MESSAVGKPDIVQFFMSLGADVNVKGKDGRTPPTTAVDNGRSTAAQVLDESEKTLLQVAASSQKLFKERLEHIRHYGDSLAERGARGLHQLPVHITDDPHQKVLKCLSHWIETTARPLMVLADNPKFLVPLHEDCEHSDLVRLLHGNGAEIGIKTLEGETLLHLAVCRAPRVKILLQIGAQVLDVNAQDKGRSALHMQQPSEILQQWRCC